MKQCDFDKHKIFVKEATDAGNPIPGDYTCLNCSSQIVIVDNGRFRVEPPKSDRCPTCGRPEDDHHSDGKGNFIFCGIGERPEVS